MRGGSLHLGREFSPGGPGPVPCCRAVHAGAGHRGQHGGFRPSFSVLLVPCRDAGAGVCGRYLVQRQPFRYLECVAVFWSRGSPSSSAGVGWLPFSCILGQWPPKFGQSRLCSEPSSWDGLVTCRPFSWRSEGPELSGDLLVLPCGGHPHAPAPPVTFIARLPTCPAHPDVSPLLSSE